MRVTETSTMSMFLRNIQTIRSRTDLLEQQVSTGTKLSAPGDDPASYLQTRQLKILRDANDQYDRNITMGLAWASQSDTAMGAMGDAITRAKEIALSMSTGTMGADARAAAAVEVVQIKNQLVQLGNTQINGQYIFGGFVTNKPPFDATPISNPADPLTGSATATYTGTTDPMKIQVGPQSLVQVNINGGDLLRGGVPAGSTGTDTFQALDNFITALKNNNPAAIGAAADQLDKGYSQVLSSRSDLGARANRLSSTQELLADVNINLDKTISDKQDIDIVSVISSLTMQQSALEAAMSAMSKITQISLTNYLR